MNEPITLDSDREGSMGVAFTTHLKPEEGISVPEQRVFVRLVASVCTVAGVLGISGCGGAVPAPKAFVVYHSPDGRFSCDYPKGWEAEVGAGKSDAPYSYAKFTMGNAEILVDADFAGSLFGDIAKASGSMAGETEAPVARVHPMGVRHMKEEFNNYQEREAKAFRSKGFGEGRRSVFSADQSLGGKTYGYRATMLSGDRRVTVLCTWPSSNWNDLMPAFEKVINSLRLGG